MAGPQVSPAAPRRQPTVSPAPTAQCSESSRGERDATWPLIREGITANPLHLPTQPLHGVPVRDLFGTHRRISIQDLRGLGEKRGTGSERPLPIFQTGTPGALEWTGSVRSSAPLYSTRLDFEQRPLGTGSKRVTAPDQGRPRDRLPQPLYSPTPGFDHSVPPLAPPVIFAALPSIRPTYSPNPFGRVDGIFSFTKTGHAQ